MADEDVLAEGGPDIPAPVLTSEARIARLESELQVIRARAEAAEAFTPSYDGGDIGGSVPPRPLGIPFPIHGEGGGEGGGRIKLPRPPCFSGEDDTDVHDWMYLLESYFAGMNVRDEGEKARILPLLLRGAAGKYARMKTERGGYRYRELIEGLKDEFGPVDGVYRARQRLRRCRQGGRNMKEYVREFRNLALSLPRTSDEELRHCFMDGLGGAGRTQVEMQRPGSLQEAILLATRAAAAVETASPEVRGSYRGGGRMGTRSREYRPGGGRVNSVEGGGDTVLHQLVHQVTDSGMLMFPLQAERMGHLLGFLEKALRRDWFRNKMTEMLDKAKSAARQVNLAHEPVVPGTVDVAEFVDSDEEGGQVEPGSVETVCAVEGGTVQGPRTLMQINATLGEKRSTVLLDSGATCNVMPAAIARKLGVGYRPQDIPLEGFDSTVSKTLGIASVATVIGEGKAKLDFVVSKGGSNILVGKAALGTLGFTLDPSLDQITHKPTGLTYKTFTVKHSSKDAGPSQERETWSVKVLPTGYAPVMGQNGSVKLFTPSPGFVLLPGERRLVELGVLGFLPPDLSGMVAGTRQSARQGLHLHPKLFLHEAEGEPLSLMMENVGSKAIHVGAKKHCGMFTVIRRIEPRLELQEKNSAGRSEA